jgi:hypothetical protein
LQLDNGQSQKKKKDYVIEAYYLVPLFISHGIYPHILAFVFGALK